MTDMRIKDVEASLRGIAQDPFRFDELVDAWNSIFDAEDARDPRSDISQAAVDETFRAIASEGTGNAISPRMRQMINALPYVVFVVRSDGLITAMNNAALAQMPFDPGDRLEETGYALEKDEPLTDVVHRALDRRNTAGEVFMKRAVHEQTDRSATLAIVPSFEGGIARALVFVIDPVWRNDVHALLSHAYDLTHAELEILVAFMDGHSLRDIADKRARSHTTVRTQFQTILSKTGARNQAELMRNTIAISQFFTDVGDVADVARHPNRRRFNMLRAGGRSVDVSLAGDLSGTLVVSIPDSSQFLFPARIEHAFKAAGLCVAFVCRPGTGQTDPAPKSQDYIACLADDIVAVIDQMKAERVVLLSNSMSTPFAYRLGSLIPDRLTRIVLTSTLVPAPFLEGARTRSPWARALMRAIKSFPGMYGVIIHSAIKAWKAMGSRRIYLMQLKGFERDEEAGRQADAVAAFDLAMRSTLSQGTEHAVLSFEYAARDWSDWVRDCQVPIWLIQGRHDPSSSYDAVRDFANRNADKITLHDVPDGGYLTFLTHTEKMMTYLKAAAKADHVAL